MAEYFAHHHHQLIGARPRSHVEQAYESLQQRAAKPEPHRQFTLGVLAAYQWAMGRVAGAPLTGARCVGVPDLEQLTSEIDTAVVQLEDTTQHSATRDFAQGVHDALVWVCGLSEDEVLTPPVGGAWPVGFGHRPRFR
ncbi:hypothetical protein [Streptantibioticus ferralitis]|uniref:Uncharacterized protein n=1 Tax=Streptantibioticus ferralitis TaxID=236510 RepID=A0ABT5Z8R3_9ACTN|nr:hypothetical protein [Streptantibioticus ferralitis]MDF2260217.1 hypothetical protein [Streptantibioticus ferralitis]